jgi:hypothetical protein
MQEKAHLDESYAGVEPARRIIATEQDGDGAGFKHGQYGQNEINGVLAEDTNPLASSQAPRREQGGSLFHLNACLTESDLFRPRTGLYVRQEESIGPRARMIAQDTDNRGIVEGAGAK